MCFFTDVGASANCSSNDQVNTVINVENFNNWNYPINSSRLQIPTTNECQSSWMISLLPSQILRDKQSLPSVKLIRLDYLQNDLEVRLQITVQRKTGKINGKYEEITSGLESWKITFPPRQQYSAPLEAGKSLGPESSFLNSIIR